MSLFRSLSGLFSSAFEATPPIIVAASRSLSLSDAPQTSSATKSTSSSTSATTSKPEVKSSSSSATSGGCDAIPEVDLSHLSVEERETIAAVLARASSAEATRTDSDIDRQVRRIEYLTALGRCVLFPKSVHVLCLLRFSRGHLTAGLLKRVAQGLSSMLMIV